MLFKLDWRVKKSDLAILRINYSLLFLSNNVKYNIISSEDKNFFAADSSEKKG